MSGDAQSVGEMRTKQAGLEVGVTVVPPSSAPPPHSCDLGIRGLWMGGWEVQSGSFLGLNLALPPAGCVLG